MAGQQKADSTTQTRHIKKAEKERSLHFMETTTQEERALSGRVAPFLTLICRACHRPKMLTKALLSAIAQTDKDLEIIFIVDNQKRGVKWANQQYQKNLDRIQGQYVYTLDDDTFLPDDRLVETIKATAEAKGYPDVIMVKGRRPQLAPNILPKSTVWGYRDRLKVTSTNGACYIAKAKCWHLHSEKYGVNAAGDWQFLKRLKNDESLTFYWLDFIAKETQQLGRGKKFEDTKKDWWKGIVETFELEENERGWFLPLWKWNNEQITRVVAKAEK